MSGSTLISVLRTAHNEFEVLSWWVPQFMDEDLEACVNYYVELMEEKIEVAECSHLTRLITIGNFNE